jgi:hypothetical protein
MLVELGSSGFPVTIPIRGIFAGCASTCKQGADSKAKSVTNKARDLLNTLIGNLKFKIQERTG